MGEAGTNPKVARVMVSVRKLLHALLLTHTLGREGGGGRLARRSVRRAEVPLFQRKVESSLETSLAPASKSTCDFSTDWVRPETNGAGSYWDQEKHLLNRVKLMISCSHWSLACGIQLRSLYASKNSISIF